MNQIQSALAPLEYFHLVSPTAAALFHGRLHRAWYRLYVLILFLAPFLAVAHLYYQNFDRLKVSPFNMNAMFIYYLVLQFAVMVYPVITARRMRISKIVSAFEELDFKMRFKDLEQGKSIRRMVVAWLVVVLALHVSVHAILVALMLRLPSGAYIVGVSSWFKLVEVVMDLELSCVGCLAWLLFFRARVFLQHLRRLLHERTPTELNLLLCHRQLHVVLKKINKAWRVQMSVILCIITFQLLRNLLSVCIHLNENVVTLIGGLLLLRYLTVLVPLCVAGQRVANVLDQIHATAVLMKDSGHDVLSSDVVRAGAAMCAEGALRARRLRCACTLDAALPLRILASTGGLLVFILQLRVDFSVFDV